jgi:hypothetical protein
MRWFNTAGPCRPEEHYMLRPGDRLGEVQALVERKAYFVVHAPRQTGKTTAFLALARELTASGRYTSALLSLETGAWVRDDPGRAEVPILDDWRGALEWQLPPELLPQAWSEAGAGRGIGAFLEAWSVASPRPLVLFLDEVDALQDAVLISVLRQLRGGFPRRPTHFPWSLALIGLRDVRDYLVAAGGSGRLGTASPFNIKTASITLRNFTEAEVGALYGQHSSETGQAWLPEAVHRAFHLTQGQPWLVNALAAELTDRIVPDRATAITAADVDRARDVLIARQDTHLDSLSERLREPRVRAIVEPLLAGATLPDVPRDDLRYVLDLGLLREDPAEGLAPANAIYREVIARDLATTPRASLPGLQPSWLDADGRLDAARLLETFVAFWRRHGEALLGAAPYHEVAPHLVLMAFLDRVVNGGGRVEREYAIGRGRMDLLVEYGDQRLAIELKVWREGEPDPLEEGLAQLDGYLAGLGLETGWLVLFDRRSGQPRIGQRTSASEATTPSGRRVSVIRA